MLVHQDVIDHKFSNKLYHHHQRVPTKIVSSILLIDFEFALARLNTDNRHGILAPACGPKYTRCFGTTHIYRLPFARFEFEADRVLRLVRMFRTGIDSQFR